MCAPVAQVAFESRVINLLDCVMSFQEFRDLAGAFILIPHPHGQRLHATMQQVTGMRIKRSTQMIKPVLDLMHYIRTTNNRPCNDIGMAVEVFRTAVQGDIETPFRWSKVDRARKSIIYQRDEVMRSGKFDNRLEVGNL